MSDVTDKNTLWDRLLLIRKYSYINILNVLPGFQ